jgi:hypothetical protein
MGALQSLTHQLHSSTSTITSSTQAQGTQAQALSTDRHTSFCLSFAVVYAKLGARRYWALLGIMQPLLSQSSGLGRSALELASS